jgi:tetratricopeptide (TPR) repeat protein
MFGRSCRSRRLPFLALAILGLLQAMPLAVAGEAVRVDPAKTTALAHFETAKRLFEVHEFGKALEEYNAAYVAKPDPAFLFNIGQCYRKLGQNDVALDFFQQFLRKAPADDPNRSQVEARIADIQAEERAKGAQGPQAKPEPTPLPAAPASLPPPAYPASFAEAPAPLRFSILAVLARLGRQPASIPHRA